MQEGALLQMAAHGEADKVSAYFHLLSSSAQLSTQEYSILKKKVTKLQGKTTLAGVAARHEEVRAKYQAEAEVEALSRLTQFDEEQIRSLRAEFKVLAEDAIRTQRQRCFNLDNAVLTLNNAVSTLFQRCFNAVLTLFQCCFNAVSMLF